MVTINTADDLLRALRENPEWKEAVRREILTEELMSLPARFDRFVEEQRQFNEDQLRFNDEQRQFNEDQLRFNDEQRQFNDDQLRFNDEQRQFNQDQLRFNDEQRQFNERVEGFIERTDRRFTRLENDISNMRGEYARDIAVGEAPDIAEYMGFRMMRVLSRDDLRELLRTSDTSGIAPSELQSFRRADLVIETADADENVHYIAVEASNTGDERDTRRAIRNAEFLARFTGQPAHSAIASIRNDERIREAIESGQVYWHRLEDRDPDPE